MSAFYVLAALVGLEHTLAAWLIRVRYARGSVGPESPKTEQARKQAAS